MKRLWSELESLANALTWLHDYCDIVHSDIKLSNILLYESHGLKQVIVAKLTEFGLAVDLQTKTSWRLGSTEAQSTLQYNAPEIRAHFRKDHFTTLPNPISQWKLRSVYVELLTFKSKAILGFPNSANLLPPLIGS